MSTLSKLGRSELNALIVSLMLSMIILNVGVFISYRVGIKANNLYHTAFHLREHLDQLHAIKQGGKP